MIPYFEKYGFDCDFVWLENTKNNMLLLFKKELTHDKAKDLFVLLTVLPIEYRIKYAKNTIQIKQPKETRAQHKLLSEYQKLQYQFGEHNFNIIKNDLFLTHEEKDKIKKEEQTLMSKFKKDNASYKAFIKEGFLENNSILHKKILNTISSFENNSHDVTLAYQIAKTKQFWHFSMGSEKYTISSKKTQKHGILFYILSENQYWDITQIKHWIIEHNFENR